MYVGRCTLFETENIILFSTLFSWICLHGKVDRLGRQNNYYSRAFEQPRGVAGKYCTTCCRDNCIHLETTTHRGAVSICGPFSRSLPYSGVGVKLNCLVRLPFQTRFKISSSSARFLARLIYSRDAGRTRNTTRNTVRPDKRYASNSKRRRNGKDNKKTRRLYDQTPNGSI